MPQVVQARCPHCKNSLRIPAEWLGRSMKCKHCQNVFQAKTKETPAFAAVSAAPLPPAPKVAYAPAPQAAYVPPEDAYDFQAPPRTRRRSSGGMWTGLLVMFGVMAVVAVVVITLGPKLAAIVQPENAKRDLATTEPSKKEKETPISTTPTPRTTELTKPETPTTTKPTPPIFVAPTPKPPLVITPPRPTPTPTSIPTPMPTPTPPVVAGKMPRRALVIHASNYLYFNSVPSRMSTFSAKLLEKPLRIDRNQLFVLSDNPADSGKSEFPYVPFTPEKKRIEKSIADFCETSREQDRIMLFFVGHGIEVEIGVKLLDVGIAKLKEEKVPDAVLAKLTPLLKKMFKDKDEFTEKLEETLTKEEFEAQQEAIVAVLDPERDAFLMPVEGEKNQVDSLIPLRWVLDQLGKSKARQKVLVLDAFRQSVTGGGELPSPDVMPESFDAMLQNPPEGVQVLSACVKEQSSIELESGSVFLQALYNTFVGDYGGQAGFTTPGDPLPIEELAAKANARLKIALEAVKKEDKAPEQTVRATGQEKPGGAPPNPEQAEATRVQFQPVSAAASNVEVDSILKQLAHVKPMKMPMVRIFENIQSANMPAFKRDTLEEYGQQGFDPFKEKLSDADLEAKRKDFPLRVAVFEAAQKLDESHRLNLRETIAKPGAAGFDGKFKTSILKESEAPSKADFEIKEMLATFDELSEKMRDKEESKRWLAHFDYTHARLKGRVIQLNEFLFLLAQIRGDGMPEIKDNQAGWRIGARAKVTTNEQKIRDMAKAIGKDWDKIAKRYPNSPWAVLAKRERLYLVGLEWNAVTRLN